MEKNHAKAIRGMSIANVIVAAAILAISILGIVIANTSIGMYLNPQPTFSFGGHHTGVGLMGAGYGGYDMDDILRELYGGAYGSSYNSDIAALNAVMGILNGIFGFVIALYAVALAAAIINLVNCKKPDKLGRMFGWSIAGAIVSLLGGNVASVVLFTLTAIFAYQDKRLFQAGFYYSGAPMQQPLYAVPPVSPNAPGGVPAAPAAAPAAPPAGAPAVTPAEVSAVTPAEVSITSPAMAPDTIPAEASAVTETALDVPGEDVVVVEESVYAIPAEPLESSRDVDDER